MSRLVSRILLSIFMFPLAGTFYVFVAVVGEQTLLRSSAGSYRDREMRMFLLAGFLTWTFVATYWCLIWRSGVRWNGKRIIGTIASAAAAALLGMITGVLVEAVVSMGGAEGFGTFIGGIATIMLWLIATIFLWRETAAERAQRVTSAGVSAISCPTCGYNLTGLSESRCPECGSRFTLDELLALQRQPTAEVDVE